MGFELRASRSQTRRSVSWATAAVILEMGVLQSICPSWSWTTILLTSASLVSRISDMSRRRPACVLFFWHSMSQETHMLCCPSVLSKCHLPFKTIQLPQIGLIQRAHTSLPQRCLCRTAVGYLHCSHALDLVIADSPQELMGGWLTAGTDIRQDSPRTGRVTFVP
jgi:hypothetical protein